MPKEGVKFVNHADILRYEEIERIIQIALQLGIVKIRLTGGEPLVRKGIVEFAGHLSRLQNLQKLSLTTNGILLPHYVASLKDAGVRYLNISLDTLNREKFHKITRFEDLDRVLDGIRRAKEVNFSRIKVNVVSVRGFNDDELFDFVAFADEYDIVVRFIEYMPFPGNEWHQGGFIPTHELKRRLEEHYQLIPLYDDPAAPAKTYSIPEHRGRIGFISSVSESFCHLCNRLRLTADGYLRPCLHGPVEIDVKGPMRRGASDEDIAELFCEAVHKKPTSHQDFFDREYKHHACDREMVRIGG
jgi:cyclic pyranopterin phosphate synthase